MVTVSVGKCVSVYYFILLLQQSNEIGAVIGILISQMKIKKERKTQTTES